MSSRRSQRYLELASLAEARNMWNFPLFPESGVDHGEAGRHALRSFELAIAGFFTVLICILIVTFAVRYRRRPMWTARTRRWRAG